MPVIALEVISKNPHPNADTLTVYEMGAEGYEPRVILANAETVYEVGDTAAVALIGTTLEDGTLVKRMTLRRVKSYGMSMGKVEAPPGTDLTDRYGASDPSEAGEVPPMIKWPHIDGFHNVRRSLHLYTEALDLPKPTVTYRAKVNLDGTNAAVQIHPDGSVWAQSRSRVLALDDDNMGFNAFVQANRAYFSEIKDPDGRITVLFGEWCGQGIQKRCSITTIGKKVFVLFAALLVDPDGEKDPLLINDPYKIAAMLGEDRPAHNDVLVLPWLLDPITVDFTDDESIEKAVEGFNSMVGVVERCDPFVMAVWGKEGLGEGVVMYPMGINSYDDFGRLVFKAKGGLHRNFKQTRAVQERPAIAQDVYDFVDRAVTGVRCEQALAEGCGGVLEMRQMGNFLKWIGQDIKRETEAELEAAGLNWRNVSRVVTAKARDWFKAKVEEI